MSWSMLASAFADGAAARGAAGLGVCAPADSRQVAAAPQISSAAGKKRDRNVKVFSIMSVLLLFAQCLIVVAPGIGLVDASGRGVATT